MVEATRSRASASSGLCARAIPTRLWSASNITTGCPASTGRTWTICGSSGPGTSSTSTSMPSGYARCSTAARCGSREATSRRCGSPPSSPTAIPICSRRRRAALKRIAKPAVEAHQGLPVKIPPFVSSDLSDWELHAFCREHDWRVWLKGPYYDAARVPGWDSFVAARAALTKVWSTEKLFLQAHVSGYEELVMLAAYRGELLGCVAMRKRDVTAEGKTWAGDVGPVDPAFEKELRRIVRELNWTGGGELEMVRDAADQLLAARDEPALPGLGARRDDRRAQPSGPAGRRARPESGRGRPRPRRPSSPGSSSKFRCGRIIRFRPARAVRRRGRPFDEASLRPDLARRAAAQEGRRADRPGRRRPEAERPTAGRTFRSLSRATSARWSSATLQTPAIPVLREDRRGPVQARRRPGPPPEHQRGAGGERLFDQDQSRRAADPAGAGERLLRRVRSASRKRKRRSRSASGPTR